MGYRISQMPVMLILQKKIEKNRVRQQLCIMSTTYYVEKCQLKQRHRSFALVALHVVIANKVSQAVAFKKNILTTLFL